MTILNLTCICINRTVFKENKTDNSYNNIFMCVLFEKQTCEVIIKPDFNWFSKKNVFILQKQVYSTVLIWFIEKYVPRKKLCLGICLLDCRIHGSSCETCTIDATFWKAPEGSIFETVICVFPYIEIAVWILNMFINTYTSAK